MVTFWLEAIIYGKPTERSKKRSEQNAEDDLHHRECILKVECNKATN